MASIRYDRSEVLMASVGYVRIGEITYINALSEDVRDRLISVLESMNLDIKYE